jgi:ABC-type nitrate/sulfonate/bicarbonate transport system substrate-binding protein
VTMPKLRWLALGVLVLTLVGCSSKSSSTNNAGGARTKVSIALDWTPNTNHTGVFVAQAKGWYAAQGLDVTILPYSEGGPEAQVAAGKADFGFSFEEGVTSARAKGQPLVSVAAVIQQNTSALVTLKDSGLDKPAKLEGKRYAGFGSAFEEPVISSIIKCDGGSSGTFENITTDVSGFDALTAKKADFVWIFEGWEAIAAKRQNINLQAFSPTKYCIPNYYTPVIVTNEKMVKDRADTVRRFVAATAQGYEYAISNPDDAADLLIKTAPQGSFPDPGLVKESAEFLAPLYKQGKSKWGEQDLKVWTDYPRFMIQSGKLQDQNGKPVTKDMDFSTFFTNNFMPR